MCMKHLDCVHNAQIVTISNQTSYERYKYKSDFWHIYKITQGPMRAVCIMVRMLFVRLLTKCRPLPGCTSEISFDAGVFLQ